MTPDDLPRAKGLDALRDQFYRSGLYHYWMNRRSRFDFKGAPVGPLIGAFCPTIKDQRLYYARQSYPLDPSLWSEPYGYAKSFKYLHGFHWITRLEDLKQAEKLILEWIERHSKWHFMSWDIQVLAHRIQNWAWVLDQLQGRTSLASFEQISKNLMGQCSHMLDRKLWGLKGMDRFMARYAQVFAYALLFPQNPAQLQNYLHLLAQEGDKLILPDGGASTRNPQTLLDVLEILERTQTLCQTLQQDFPIALLNLKERIYPLIKSLSTPLSTLAIFQGAHGGVQAQFDRVFAKGWPPCKALHNAPHSGYQRLECAQSVLIMDCGPPAEPALNAQGTASTFSFEFWDGENCLITNCGSFMDGPPDWQAALQTTKAHSCLVVDESDQRYPMPSFKKQVKVTRYTEKSNQLIEGYHEGYLDEFGLIHKRALFMGQNGHDIRIEDHLIGSGGNRFDLHLHLHPSVKASQGHDENSILLELPKGPCWILSSSGVKISLEESIYFGHLSQMQPTQQVILSGPLRGEGTLVKWRLHYVGMSKRYTDI